MTSTEVTKTLSAGEEIVPHVTINYPSDADLDVTIRPAEGAPGAVLSIRGDRQVPWISMNVALSPSELAGLDYLGVHAQTTSPMAITTAVCLRQHNDVGFTDTFFKKHIVSYEQPSSHLDQLALADTLMPQATGAELLLFFESRDFTLHISKLKLFAV